MSHFTSLQKKLKNKNVGPKSSIRVNNYDSYTEDKNKEENLLSASNPAFDRCNATIAEWSSSRKKDDQPKESLESQNSVCINEESDSEPFDDLSLQKLKPLGHNQLEEEGPSGINPKQYKTCSSAQVKLPPDNQWLQKLLKNKNILSASVNDKKTIIRIEIKNSLRKRGSNMVSNFLSRNMTYTINKFTDAYNKENPLTTIKSGDVHKVLGIRKSCSLTTYHKILTNNPEFREFHWKFFVSSTVDGIKSKEKEQYILLRNVLQEVFVHLDLRGLASEYTITNLGMIKDNKRYIILSTFAKLTDTPPNIKKLLSESSFREVVLSINEEQVRKLMKAQTKYKADLTEADLTEADLTEADLTEADLTGNYSQSLNLKSKLKKTKTDQKVLPPRANNAHRLDDSVYPLGINNFKDFQRARLAESLQPIENDTNLWLDIPKKIIQDLVSTESNLRALNKIRDPNYCDNDDNLQRDYDNMFDDDKHQPTNSKSRVPSREASLTSSRRAPKNSKILSGSQEESRFRDLLSEKDSLFSDKDHNSLKNQLINMRTSYVTHAKSQETTTPDKDMLFETSSDIDSKSAKIFECDNNMSIQSSPSNKSLFSFVKNQQKNKKGSPVSALSEFESFNCFQNRVSPANSNPASVTFNPQYLHESTLLSKSTSQSRRLEESDPYLDSFQLGLLPRMESE